jgi:hypothetical protein
MLLILVASPLFTIATVIGQSTVLTVNDPWVSPGQAVRVTVTTAPNARFAIVASSSGTGGAVAGMTLEVGADYVLIASGVADATGRSTISYTPTFSEAGPERIYLQAGSQGDAPGTVVSLSNSVVLTNLVARTRNMSPLSFPYLEDSGTPPKRIGVAAFHGTWFSWHALLEYEGRFFRVQVNESGPMVYSVPVLLELTSPSVFFQDSECSGAPLVFGGDEWGGDAAVRGMTLYIPLADALPSPVTLRSQWLGGTCYNSVFLPASVVHSAVAIPFPAFTPPLKLIVPTP